jgi:hypothetical protein
MVFSHTNSLVFLLGRRPKIEDSRAAQSIPDAREAMSVTASESLTPLGEPQATARRKRLAHLARMVFHLMRERFQGGTDHEYDGIENAGLIDALRVCSSYTDQIGCLNYEDSLVIQLEGIDGHDYIIHFSLFGPGFSVHASRVRVTKLPLLVGPKGQVESTFHTLDVLQEYSRRLKLGAMTTDRAFLIGMSIVIGFMDEQGEDQGEDARLAPLVAQVMPTSDELREIRAKLPPSSINYDEEGDLPY